MRYFIQLSYDGTSYRGWQVQDNSSSVQELIEQGLKFKTGLNGRIVGCGRTDAGVHARQFFAHFDLIKRLDEMELKDLCREMNHFLPKDIAVLKIFSVMQDAHCRFDAKSRTYKYYISRKKDPFIRNYSWLYQTPLDVEKMVEASKILFDYEDFTSFSKLHTDVKTNNCKISRADWTEDQGQLIFTITADRFLRNMVRAIVGTLIEVGKGKISLDDFRKVIESKDRANAGFSVPAQGLFLEGVEYSWEDILIDKKR
jgi:tRNA pseudouridine38-40 synthase